MQNGHVAFVIGEFDRVLGPVSVVLDLDAVSIMQIIGHKPVLAEAIVGPVDGNDATVDRDVLEMPFLAFFRCLAVASE